LDFHAVCTFLLAHIIATIKLKNQQKISRGSGIGSQVIEYNIDATPVTTKHPTGTDKALKVAATPKIKKDGIR